MIVHRGQRDAGKAGVENVIEADDGVVPGELGVVLGKSVDDAHGHHIVDGDEGRIGAREQLRPLGHGPPDAVADVVARRMLNLVRPRHHHPEMVPQAAALHLPGDALDAVGTGEALGGVAGDQGDVPVPQGDEMLGIGRCADGCVVHEGAFRARAEETKRA